MITALKYLWKFSSIALILYVFAMVLTVPLGPGLLDQTIKSINGNNVEIEVHGYATHFDQRSEGIKGFLSSKEDLITVECSEVIVEDANTLTLRATLPDTANSRAWSVKVNSVNNGWLSLNPEKIKDPVHIGIPTDLSFAVADLHQEEFFKQDLGFHFPFQPRILESIRNLPLHVPMWFTMFLLMAITFVASIIALSTNKSKHALMAYSATKVGVLFGVLGILTGSLWAKGAWGAWWVIDDPQLNGALVSVLVYMGYLILRKVSEDTPQKAKLSAGYAIFAFAILFILLMIMPRYTDSLHPGKSGNPAFSKYDLDNSLRLVFYPAVVGWILLGIWMYNITLKAELLKEKIQRKLEY